MLPHASGVAAMVAFRSGRLKHIIAVFVGVMRGSVSGDFSGVWSWGVADGGFVTRRVDGVHDLLVCHGCRDCDVG
jgi:hypothetical protein